MYMSYAFVVFHRLVVLISLLKLYFTTIKNKLLYLSLSLVRSVTGAWASLGVANVDGNLSSHRVLNK